MTITWFETYKQEPNPWPQNCKLSFAIMKTGLHSKMLIVGNVIGGLAKESFANSCLGNYPTTVQGGLDLAEIML